MNNVTVPGTIVGCKHRYRLETQIAQGGLASIWLGSVVEPTQTSWPWPWTTVIIKLPIHLSDAKYLEEEARIIEFIWKDLPNYLPQDTIRLVEILDHGPHVTLGYIVIERYYDQKSLNAVYYDAVVPISEMARILQEVAPTLDCVHKLNILHNDIKMSNLLLDSTGRVVVADFNTYGWGNPRYVSPEAARYHCTGEGRDEIDARSDIYSLGVLLYRALTGAYPLDWDINDDDVEAMYAEVYDKLITNPVMIDNPCITPYVDQVLDKALQRSRSDRFQTVKDLADAFSDAISMHSVFSGRIPNAGFDELTPIRNSRSDRAPALVSPLQYGAFLSCFISYSSKDQVFVERLFGDLRTREVQCWYAPEDLKIGDRLRIRIVESIERHEKTLLVLSEYSLNSMWVADEVEAALDKEERYGTTVLFPITIDDAVWKCQEAWAAKVRRERYIGDFRRWEEREAYQAAFERLLRSLRVEGSDGK